MMGEVIRMVHEEVREQINQKKMEENIIIFGLTESPKQNPE